MQSKVFPGNMGGVDKTFSSSAAAAGKLSIATPKLSAIVNRAVGFLTISSQIKRGRIEPFRLRISRAIGVATLDTP